MSIRERISSLDWHSVYEQLDKVGYALTEALLSSSECETLAKLYDGSPEVFRTTIDMSRYNFGSGQYRYFSYPLPGLVQDMRESFYPHLAMLANQWATKLSYDVRWPDSHQEFIGRCHKNEQRRPTPLLLNYVAGDYNCLHQDLYGDIYFPFQVILMLSDPATDFDGGELVLVENRPRMQSRASVLRLSKGCAAIIPVRERPRKGARGYHRAQMRHGVGDIRSGRRQTMGVIFHDAK
jgi:hypothetical protein